MGESCGEGQHIHSKKFELILQKDTKSCNVLATTFGSPTTGVSAFRFVPLAQPLFYECNHKLHAMLSAKSPFGASSVALPLLASCISHRLANLHFLPNGEA